MGKHVPLPSDPTDRAAEKKKRFKAYQKDWKRGRRAEAARIAIARAKDRRELEQSARRLNIDLCLDLSDLSAEGLRKNIATAESWIS